MIPAGYMAKRVCTRPGWLQSAIVTAIHSVSGCVSENFADYINYWKHNGYWLFDSAEAIESLAMAQGIDLGGTTLFYYEVYEQQFDREWQDFGPEGSFLTDVREPVEKCLQGYDVVSFAAGTSPECSPLSCNRLANDLGVNRHCLFETFEDAVSALDRGMFKACEPGPYRIFAVYTVARGPGHGY